MNQSALELQPANTVYTDEHGPYCLIPLTLGQFAKVDPGDYKWLSQWKWRAHRNPKCRTFYATRTSRSISMHREIKKPPAHKVVDHEDGDGLNNRRYNLRIATRGQNQFNSRKPVTNKSGFKGVSWYKRRQIWIATISLQDKTTHLGYFDTPEAAHEAYKKAAREMHGEFANFG